MGRIVDWLRAVVVLGLVLLVGCGEPRVAVIDLDAVARALGRDDVIQQQITSANEQLNNQLLEVARNLQAQVQERQAALDDSASEADKAQAEQELGAANEQLRKTQALARQRSAEFRSAVINNFRQEVAGVAERVATERGVKAVLTMGASLLWFDATVDITDEVIADLRAGGGVNSAARAAAPGAPGRSEAAKAADAAGG